MASGTPTHCPYCALQCGMVVGGDPAGGSPVGIAPRADVPAGAGGLCQKGWTAAELLTTGDRLTTPLMRVHAGAPLEPCTWDAALERIAAEIERLQAAYGPDAVAVFGGGGLTNEKAYQLGKFARVGLRTANIDYNGRFCMSSAAAALNRAFGMDRGLPVPITDVESADAVMLVGGNVAETMPPFMRHLAAQRANGGQLIVIDPRATATARGADLHLQPTPGTDMALANGLLHIAIAEGLIDEAYIAARTRGFDAVRTMVNAYWPDRVERITGVPVPHLRRAVWLLAGATGEMRDRGIDHTALVLTARGAEQHADGTDTVSAYINLSLALGLPGRPGSGYGCLTGQGNGQGGREHGQKADQLPGYRKIDNPEHRAHAAKVWGIDPEELPQPGVSAYEMLDRLGEPDGVRA
ncbi:MAG TPA: molybdopterin-dependent oxidoreductase, partial [Streptosporangiaceae bacterium]